MLIEKTNMVHFELMERLDSNRAFDFASSASGMLHMATVDRRPLNGGVLLRMIQIWKDEVYVAVYLADKAERVYRLWSYDKDTDDVAPFDWVQLDLIDSPIE